MVIQNYDNLSKSTDTKTVLKQLDLKVGNVYRKKTGNTNSILKIDDEKIKYSIGKSSKYIRLALLTKCYEKLFKEKLLLVKWIKEQDKIQPCDPQLILAIFVKVKLASYYIPKKKIRPIGINYTT